MAFSLQHRQLFHSPTRFSSQPKSITNHSLISLKIPTRLSNHPLAFAQNAAISQIDSEKAALLPPPLRKELMPNHVAVIMDGNRRWAKMKGLPIALGYEAGVRAFRNLIQLCCNWGISVLTVFAFSSDNWFRPKVKFIFKCWVTDIGYYLFLLLLILFLLCCRWKLIF